jgi:hypothetical protein
LETIFITRMLCFYKLLFHLLHIKLNKTGILDKFYVFLDKFFALLKVRGSAVTTIIWQPSYDLYTWLMTSLACPARLASPILRVERATYALEDVMDPAKTLSIKGLPTPGLRCSLWHRFEWHQVGSLVRTLGIHRRLSGKPTFLKRPFIGRFVGSNTFNVTITFCECSTPYSIWLWLINEY